MGRGGFSGASSMGLAVRTECCNLSRLMLALRMLCLLWSMMDIEGLLECPWSPEPLWSTAEPPSGCGEVRGELSKLCSKGLSWSCGEIGNGGGVGGAAGASDESDNCWAVGRVGGMGSGWVCLVLGLA